MDIDISAPPHTHTYIHTYIHTFHLVCLCSPPSISVFNYNSRLVPKFSYKSQLMPPPADLPDLEKKWACNVLRTPFNRFPLALLYFGKQYGFYQLQSIYLQSASAAIRSAHNTVNNWSYSYTFLQNKVFSSFYVTLDFFNKDLFSPSFWDSPPFCVNLNYSSKGTVFHNH